MHQCPPTTNRLVCQMTCQSMIVSRCHNDNLFPCYFAIFLTLFCSLHILHRNTAAGKRSKSEIHLNICELRSVEHDRSCPIRDTDGVTHQHPPKGLHIYTLSHKTISTPAVVSPHSPTDIITSQG